MIATEQVISLAQSGTSSAEIARITGLTKDAVDHIRTNNKNGIILGRVSPCGQHSKCQDCANCDCSWIKSKTPVDGWTAEPSKLYRDGWAVKDCPEFEEFPKREIIHEHLSNLDPLRRCRVCGEVIGSHCKRTKYCSDACYRKACYMQDKQKRKEGKTA